MNGSQKKKPEESRMPTWFWIIFGSTVAGLAFGVILFVLYKAFPAVPNIFKGADSHLALVGVTIALVGVTAVIALANLALVIQTSRNLSKTEDSLNLTKNSLNLTKNSLNLARKANIRAEKLFVAQNKPLIDVTPRRIWEDPGEGVTTEFSVINYSSFDAHNIGVALRYKDIWIEGWLRADEDRKKKQQGTEQQGPIKYVTRISVLQKILEGDITPSKILVVKIGGSFSFGEICSKGKCGMKVLVRATWENENGHVFDEVRKYKLVCTEVEKGGKVGRNFTFFPLGIASSEDFN